jgi:hypothetical protein
VEGSATSRLAADKGASDTPTDPATVASLREPTGGWPKIEDYWPDSPQRMSPAADYSPDDAAPVTGGAPSYPQDPTPTRIFSPPPPPARPWLRVLLGALGALVFLGGSVFALARLVAGPGGGEAQAPPAPVQSDANAPAEPSPPVSVEPSPSATSAQPSAEPSATATALPFESGVFELTGDVVELNLTVADLGNEAFTISSPEGSGLEPRATVDGDEVKVASQPDGSQGSGRLDVRLNEKIAWGLRLSGGMKNASLTLADADLRGIDVRGGAARLDMTLPGLDETLPIRMSGGVNTWNIITAREVPVTMVLRDGGGEVVLNGERARNIDRGTTLRAKVDGDDDDGLEIEAVAGLGKLTVEPADD